MFRLVEALLLSITLAVTATAYQITVPNDLASGGGSWTTAGPNSIVWQRVDTDPSTFTIVLVNEVSASSMPQATMVIDNVDRSVLPVNDQLLASNVDGNALSIAVAPASGSSFPAGSGFRINFVKSANDLDTIYAQSSQFTIGGSGSSNSMSTSNSVVTGTVASASNNAAVTQTPHATYTASDDTQTVTVTASASRSKEYVGFSPTVLVTLLGAMFSLLFTDFM